MPNLTLAIPEDLKRRMDKHKDIRWSEVVRASISERIDKLDLLDELLKDSKLTDEGVQKIAASINKGMARRFGLR